jgi:hypothetical protein
MQLADVEINNPDDAISLLQRFSVIGDQSYWQTAVKNVPYLGALMINIAQALKGMW